MKSTRSIRSTRKSMHAGLPRKLSLLAALFVSIPAAVADPASVAAPQLVDPASADVGRAGPMIREPVDGARTMFEFDHDYAGPDKKARHLNSFSVGRLNGGACSGAMVSPHLFMTAAHCGGPGHIGTVQFLHIDEDSSSPGPGAQTWSAEYPARTLPWQSFGASTGGGDTVLWWLSDGADGIAPGVKYGSVELSDVEATVGDEAYSFWVNPVENFRGQRLASTVLHSSGSAIRREVSDWRGPTTEYNLYGAPGASGSAVFGGAKHGHRVIGVTSCAPVPEGPSRCTSDTTHFLRQHDAERNGVLDAIEYDWVMTEPRMAFRFLSFDTVTSRAHWLSVPNGGGSINTESGLWAGKVVPGPGTTDGLWHRTARFAPNTTYRFSVVVRSAAGGSGYIKLRSDTGPGEVVAALDPGTSWIRLTGRLTTGGSPHYRLLLGANLGATLYVRDVSFTQENAGLTFGSGDERRTWEAVGASHITSWGLAGAGDLSGVMAGPTPSGIPWGLRNRNVALRPNRTYEVLFTVRHVSGGLDQNATFSVEDLGGNSVGRQTWTFTSAGQQLARRIVVTTNTHSGHTIVFGGGSLTYLVDNVLIREL